MSKVLLSENAARKIYRDGDKVLKMFRQGFPKSEVFNEAFVNARAEDLCEELVPKVEGVFQEEGCWGIQREYIEGDTLEALLLEHPEKKQAYMEMMLHLQLSLLSRKAPKLQQLKTKMAQQLNELEGIDDATRYELLTRLDKMPVHDKLCHGDFRPSNIIIGKDGKTYVIDWVHAARGNASADIARTYLILALTDKAMAEEYLQAFCEKTGTARKYVEDWLPIVAAAQLTKKRPEEIALLESWLNICDHM